MACEHGNLPDYCGECSGRLRVRADECLPICNGPCEFVTEGASPMPHRHTGPNSARFVTDHDEAVTALARERASALARAEKAEQALAEKVAALAAEAERCVRYQQERNHYRERALKAESALSAAEAGRREAEAGVAVLAEHLKKWAILEAFRGRAVLFPSAPKVTPEEIANVMGPAERDRHNLPASAKAHAEWDARMAEFFAHFCRDPYAEVLRELASTPAADLSPDKDTQHTAALGRMFVALAALDGKAGG